MSKQPPLNDEERAELVAYLDGELDGERARGVEARISRDPRIRAEAEALGKAWELLDYLPRPEPSPNFTHRTLDRISAPQTAIRIPPGRRWRTVLFGVGWAAAVVLAVLGGYAGVNLLAPPDRTDEELARDLRVIENKRLYDPIDDIDFLRQLDVADLFGDDNSGS
jgi:anti-sigma factor RsiW